MRASGSEEGDSVPVTARQLEALVRVAEASARAELDDKVTEKDAQRAIDILTYCLEQVGVDPETGEFDIDMMESGVSGSQRSRLQTVKKIIESEAGDDDSVEIEKVVEKAAENDISEDQAEEVINRLKRDGELFEPEQGKIQRI
jgi:replicative DNA helicase Mcm